MDTIVLVGVAAALLVGLVGTVVHPLPGVALIWAAVLTWASVENTAAAWITLGIATGVAVAGYVARQLLAGLRPAQIVAPARSLGIAAATGLAGYLLARTLGLLAGFAAGLYVAERRRLRLFPSVAARPEPRQVLSRPALVELCTGVLVAGAWVIAVAG